MATTHDLTELQRELQDISGLYPAFRADDVFVHWFLRAYVTDDESAASTAVSGGSGDKSVDAVYIDHRAEIVYLVQGKNRQSSRVTEKRDDIMGFAALAQPLSFPDIGPFKTLIEGMHPHVAKLLTDARQYLTKKSYRLRMFFVTLGGASEGVIKEAQQVVARAKGDTHLEVFTTSRVLHIFRDYLDGVAPPIPTLDLEMEEHAQVDLSGILQRFDRKNNIESWVVSMKGDKIADLFEFAGVRLFARNIRGFLGGGGAINAGMSGTLTSQPDRFFYYNNGITIICDHAEHKARKGKKLLTVSNPQIINGQQTTRMLAANKSNAADASVLVKVMQVPRMEGSRGADKFDELVSQIVASTNWQNAISYADLVSNDRVQVELERELRKFDYFYVRKRQTKGEAKSIAGKKYIVIKKEELAQAVAGCDLDPSVPREGKNALFDKHYNAIFRHSDPYYYLPRYWAFVHITSSGKKNSLRSWMKWPALHYLWHRLGPSLRKQRAAKRFWVLCERRNSYLNELLSQACNLIYDELLAFYNANRGTGDELKDISAFFRGTKGRHDQFEKQWTWTKTRSSKLEHVWQRILAELDEDA